MADVRTLGEDNGPLHELFIKACPPCKKVFDDLVGESTWIPCEEDDPEAVRSIAVLASLIGSSRWSVFKWAKAEHIAPRWVSKIVEVSDERVTKEDFYRYLFT